MANHHRAIQRVAKYGLSRWYIERSAAFLSSFFGIYSTLSCVDEDINNHQSEVKLWKSDRLNRASKRKAKAQDTAKSISTARTDKTGYSELYPYLTRLQVAKFSLAGGFGFRKTLLGGNYYKLSGSQNRTIYKRQFRQNRRRNGTHEQAPPQRRYRQRTHIAQSLLQEVGRRSNCAMEKDNERVKRHVPREEKFYRFRRYDYNVGYGVLRAARLEERRRNAFWRNGVFQSVLRVCVAGNRL